GTHRTLPIRDDPVFDEKFYSPRGEARENGSGGWEPALEKTGGLFCGAKGSPEPGGWRARAGAEIPLIPTAIGWHPAEKTAEGAAQHNAWQTIQRSHAIANGCFVAAVNRIGHEAPADDADDTDDASGTGGKGIEFWGQSFVAAPSGEIIAQAAADQPETLLVQVDLSQVNEARTHWPFLRDRRIDAYGGITERFLDS
nr:acyltransferase [Limisphaerales bacterium]